MKLLVSALLSLVSAKSAQYKPTEAKINVLTWGNEISYKITNGNGATVCSGGPFAWHDEHALDCNLEEGSYNLECIDSYGDGWHGGYITIDNKEFCRDFRSGHKTSRTFRTTTLQAQTLPN